MFDEKTIDSIGTFEIPMVLDMRRYIGDQKLLKYQTKYSLGSYVNKQAKDVYKGTFTLSKDSEPEIRVEGLHLAVYHIMAE